MAKSFDLRRRRKRSLNSEKLIEGFGFIVRNRYSNGGAFFVVFCSAFFVVFLRRSLWHSSNMATGATQYSVILGTNAMVGFLHL